MCKRGKKFKTCNIKNASNEECGVWHHRLLHGTYAQEVEGMSLFTGSTSGGKNTLLLIQKIKMKANRKPITGVTAFDSCSNVTLCTHKFGIRSGAHSVPYVLPLGAIQGVKSTVKTRKYFFQVTNDKGVVHEIQAYGLPCITTTFKAVTLSKKDINKLKSIPHFKPPHSLFHREKEDLDLLIGMDYASLHPAKKHSVDNLVVYRSCIKGTSPYLLGGVVESQKKDDSVCCLVDSNATKFFSVEDFGVRAQKSCKSCQNCSECNFISSQISNKEKAELEMIQNNLWHDEDKQKWTAKYPITGDLKDISVASFIHRKV